ncbi:MAG TPA: PEP-utilizing enzyme, partial [Chloroflexota bacterium]|nr:PEP-utilizing enzyme [Chloroflexota bacterium]
GAPAWRTAVTVARAFGRTRIPQRAALALARPATARERAARHAAASLTLAEVPADATAAQRLDAFERLLLDGLPILWPNAIPVVLAGIAANLVLARLLRGVASDTERRLLTRGLPHNPTTEMDLALWALARQVQQNGGAAGEVRAGPPARLAAAYREGLLPPPLQGELEGFLHRYGHRAVAEIDLGLPRWGEDPSYLLGALANYLQLGDAAQGPDVQFRQAATRAEATARELVRRAAGRGRLRALAVRFLLGRGRALAGARELPKFLLVLLLAQARATLAPVGEHLVATGRLEAAGDLWFLTLPETRRAVLGGGPDLRPLVRARRERYEDERRRRRVPRLLLSDGTEPEMAAPATQPPPAVGTALRGSPASAGQATGRARVVLDPLGARLEPGDILVAPSTDPGWTPLFLTAGGLVMEMGGAMSHGAVVAREYGIPAVVGLAGATERIPDGATILVDGTAGTVVEIEPRGAPD